MKTLQCTKLLTVMLLVISNLLTIDSAYADKNQVKGHFISSKIGLLSDQQNKQLATQLSNSPIVATVTQSTKSAEELANYKKLFNLTLTATRFKMDQAEIIMYRDMLDNEMKASHRIAWAYPDDSDAGLFTTLSIETIDNKNLIVESIIFVFDYAEAKKSTETSINKFVDSSIWYIVLRKKIKLSDLDTNASPAASLFPIHKELVKLGISKIFM